MPVIVPKHDTIQDKFLIINDLQARRRGGASFIYICCSYIYMMIYIEDIYIYIIIIIINIIRHHQQEHPNIKETKMLQRNKYVI